jgi:hypothetical protein
MMVYSRVDSVLVALVRLNFRFRPPDVMVGLKNLLHFHPDDLDENHHLVRLADEYLGMSKHHLALYHRYPDELFLYFHRHPDDSDDHLRNLPMNRLLDELYFLPDEYLEMLNPRLDHVSDDFHRCF